MRFLQRVLWRTERSRPGPSPEALINQAEMEALRPRVESVMRERHRLLAENNYTARIRALYQEGRA